MAGAGAALLDRLSLTSGQQRLLRGVVLGAALVFVGLVPAAAGSFHPVLSLVAVLLAVVATVLPESNAALALVVYLAVLWLLAVPPSADLWSLVAAVDVAVLHLACTVASYGPPGLTVHSSVLRQWLRRLGFCVGAAAVAWGFARLVTALRLGGGAPVLAAALGVILAALALLTVRLTGRQPGSGEE